MQGERIRGAGIQAFKTFDWENAARIIASDPTKAYECCLLDPATNSPISIDTHMIWDNGFTHGGDESPVVSSNWAVPMIRAVGDPWTCCWAYTPNWVRSWWPMKARRIARPDSKSLYVAAPFAEKHLAYAMAQTYICSNTWHTSKYPSDQSASWSHLSEARDQCMAEIADCDLFVLFDLGHQNSFGRMIEFGYALALGKPTLTIINHPVLSNIFIGATCHSEDREDVLNWLCKA